MAYTLAALSDLGWTDDPERIVDKLFSYFLASHYSQSNMFLGHIASLPYLIYEYQNNMDQLVFNIEDTLRKMYGRYFDNVEVSVSVNTINDSNTEMTISILVSLPDRDIELSRVLQYKDSSSIEVIDVNNG